MSARARRRHRAGAGHNVKVVVTGPFAAGKTTFIRTISEITVLGTERAVTDETRARKTSTTVAMDHGRITVDRDLVLSLFGTPGQDRFEVMWEVLSEGMLGWVLLLDGTAATPAEDARTVAAAFRELGRDVPAVVAVNRGPAVSEEAAAAVRAVLALDAATPVLSVDCADKASVKEVLLTLLDRVLADRRGQLVGV